MTNTYCILFVD